MVGGASAVTSIEVLHLPPGLVGVGGAFAGLFGIAPAVKAKMEEVRRARLDRTGEMRHES